MNINVESLLYDSLAGTTLGTIVPNNNRPSQNAGGAGPITLYYYSWAKMHFVIHGWNCA